MFNIIAVKKYCLLTFVTETSATTVYSENVEHPIKWNNFFPLHENLDVPSGIYPWPCVILIFWHKLVLGDLQNLHSPHCGTYNGITVSPIKNKCILIIFADY